jgi:hypothetical protein
MTIIDGKAQASFMAILTCFITEGRYNENEKEREFDHKKKKILE